MPNYGLIILLSLTTISSIFSTTYSQCGPSGSLVGTQAPTGQCDPRGSDCCQAGSSYPTYTCSPPVTGETAATLTMNSFQQGGDGGGPSECYGKYYSDDTPVVALSTGWYAGGSLCGSQIVIQGNGQSTSAMVVDECDSTVGCDAEHGYQPPCGNSVVDASKAVWVALGVDSTSDQYGQMAITWSLA